MVDQRHWSESHHLSPAPGPPVTTSGPPPLRPQRDRTASTGPFMSVEQLAVSAVLDDAKPLSVVARTLRVPTSLVTYWVSKVDSGELR